MDKQELSPRQRAMMEFINRFSEENGYPPTIREIGAAVNIPSTSVVNYNLNKLNEEGFITRSKKSSRGIRVIDDRAPMEADLLSVPMVGQIVAGLPTPHLGDDLDYYDEDATIPVPASFVGNNNPDEIYALTVNGLSMIDAMINDGDVVVLKHQETAHNGEMVAVWLTEGGETTLKRFYDEGERIRLQPANPTMKPIFVDKGKIQIQGKVLAVLRHVE
jgi:repressor LexA